MCVVLVCPIEFLPVCLLLALRVISPLPGAVCILVPSYGIFRSVTGKVLPGALENYPVPHECCRLGKAGSKCLRPDLSLWDPPGRQCHLLRSLVLSALWLRGIISCEP